MIVSIAWPARLMNIVLGVPAARPTTSDGKLRYRACQKCANSIGPANVAGNLFLLVVKAYLGITGGSKALVADAIHSGADLVSSIMLLLGLRVARRPADSSYPYGYGKVEYLVSVIIYTSLLAAGVVIFVDALSCIVHRREINPTAATLGGAVVSVILNELMFRQSLCAGTQLGSPSMVANAWEKRSDAFSSIAVLAGIAGAKMGLHFLDPAAAILVAFYIAKISVQMLSDAFRRLLDPALAPAEIEKIRTLVAQVAGVLQVTSVRSREIGQKIWIDLEAQVAGDVAVADSLLIKATIEKETRRAVNRPVTIVVYLSSEAS